MCHQYYCSPSQQVLMCNFILFMLWVFEVLFIAWFLNKVKISSLMTICCTYIPAEFCGGWHSGEGHNMQLSSQQTSVSTWNNYCSSTLGPLLCTVKHLAVMWGCITAPYSKGPHTYACDCADLWYSAHLPQQLICSKVINLNLILLTAKGEILL